MNREAHKARVCYVVSNDLVKTSSLLPSNKNRSLLVHSLVKQLGLLSPGWSDKALLTSVAPTPAHDRDLTVYHDADYLDFIFKPRNRYESSEDSSRSEFGIEEDCPSFKGLTDYVRLVAGASLSAANSLIEDRADSAICWDGGRHHALKSQASGFCYVADCVLAILQIRRSRLKSDETTRRKPRIMYLDLDLHFSDGVSQAFVSSSSGNAHPQILVLSVHHAAPGFFPASPLAALSDPLDPFFDPFTLSLPLARGASDATFSSVWRSIETIKEAFSPDYVVIQCGVDGLAGDPCGVWNWSLGASDGSLGWCINRICRDWNCKTLFLGGGGYNSPNAARAWAYLTSIVLRKPLSLDTDIPDHGPFPLYAPSFTLDVPAGNSQDLNTEPYLIQVEEHFAQIAEIIRTRMS